MHKPERAAGAPGGQRPPESGPRPFLRHRPPGKQRVNDRVKSLTDLRPLRAGSSARDATARSGEGTSPPARGDTGRDPRTRAGISGGGSGLAAARSAAPLRDYAGIRRRPCPHARAGRGEGDSRKVGGVRGARGGWYPPAPPLCPVNAASLRWRAIEERRNPGCCRRRDAGARHLPSAIPAPGGH